MGARRSRWVRLHLLAIWRFLLGCLGSARSVIAARLARISPTVLVAVARVFGRRHTAGAVARSRDLLWRWLEVHGAAHAAPPCLAWAARAAR